VAAVKDRPRAKPVVKKRKADDITIRLRSVGEWWAATVDEMPEIHTQGHTREEAISNVADAIHELSEAKKLLA